MSKNFRLLRGKISRSDLLITKPHIKRVPQALWQGLRQPALEAGYSFSIFEKEFSLESPTKRLFLGEQKYRVAQKPFDTRCLISASSVK